MKRLLIPSALLVAVFAGTGSAQNSTSSYTPAVFVEGENSLANLVEFPNHSGDIEIGVICLAHASIKGRLRDVYCSAPDDPRQKFTKAVTGKVYSAELIPATVAGKNEEVDFQFLVEFRKEGDERSINVYLNNAKNTDRLGKDYISAQRYSSHALPPVCNDPNTWGFTGGQELIMEVAQVSAGGQPVEILLLSEVWRIPATCRLALESQIRSSRWIPASLDGEAIDSIWASPIIMNRAEVIF
jgi:hypothetical protein